MVVEEREKRVIENMENMGMKKISYISSAMCFNFTFYLVFSIILVPLIKYAFIPNINGLLIFVIFIIFTYWVIAISYFVSNFFVNAKKSGIYALIIFVFLFLFQILIVQFYDRGTVVTTVLSLVPLGAMAITSKNLLSAQSVYYNYGFGDLNIVDNNFAIRTFFIIGILSIIIFVLLAFYLFYVMPLEIGTADHPLFFLGFSWNKSSSRKLVVGNASNESN